MIEFDETFIRDNDLRRTFAQKYRGQKLPPEIEQGLKMADILGRAMDKILEPKHLQNTPND